jgi:hypothetical protein
MCLGKFKKQNQTCKTAPNSQFHVNFKYYFTPVSAETFPHSFQLVLATWSDTIPRVKTQF